MKDFNSQQYPQNPLYFKKSPKGIRRFINCQTFRGPVNIGSEEMVSIDKLVEIAAKVSKKSIVIKHIPGPLGVRGRNSDSKLIKEKL